MRNIKHHSIIVTSNDKESLILVRNEILRLYKLNMEAKNGGQLVSPIVDSLINKFSSFFIAPDGSKEGYDASDDGDRVRKKIVDFLNSLQEPDGSNGIRFVEVSYGDDFHLSKVESNN
jgi:hypothetical protein